MKKSLRGKKDRDEVERGSDWDAASRVVVDFLGTVSESWRRHNRTSAIHHGAGPFTFWGRRRFPHRTRVTWMVLAVDSQVLWLMRYQGSTEYGLEEQGDAISI